MNHSKKSVHSALISADTPESAARLLIQAKGGAFVATLNWEMLARATEDAKFQEVLQQADYRICDSIGAKLLLQRGTPHAAVPRIAGIDLGSAILSVAAEQGTPIFLLGGRPGVADIARRRLAKAYPKLRITGCAHGYFTPADLPALRGRINASRAEILFVCLGSPQQEKWILQNRAYLPSVRLYLPLGGSLDVWAGSVSRAPLFLQRAGAEWLWRILHQPSRITRFVRSCGVFWKFSRKNSPKCRNLFQIE